MDELEELIQEQKEDERLGVYQPPESRQALEFYDWIDYDSHRDTFYPECAIHGRGRMKFDPRPDRYYAFYCMQCRVEASTRWRQRNRDKVNAQRRERYARDPEKFRAAAKRHREKAKERKA